MNIKCAKNSLALGIMYRPPSYVNEYFNNMLDQIDNVFSYYEDVVLMGDLHYDYKPVFMHQIEVLYGMQQLKEIGTIKRFYSVYDVYYGLLHFIQPSVITKCGFIPEKRS